jgi:exonuclease III
VRHVINILKHDMICLQETKLAVITPALVRNVVGADFESSFAFLLADGTRGGILLAARVSTMQISNPVSTEHTISVSVLDSRRNMNWMLTGVYGPQGEQEKNLFIRELRNLKLTAHPKWLIIGDFNLIYKAQDKNSGNLNHRLMNRFQRGLNYMEIKEIHLRGRRFIWSNNQNPPIMTRIDRAFCSPSWETSYSSPILQAHSSSSSDHSPLLLLPLVIPKSQPKFRFEAHWPQILGFNAAVSEAWNKEVPQ